MFKATIKAGYKDIKLKPMPQKELGATLGAFSWLAERTEDDFSITFEYEKETEGLKLMTFEEALQEVVKENEHNL